MKSLSTSVFGWVVFLCMPTGTTHGATLKSIVETSVLPIFNAAIGFIMTLSVLAFIVGVIRFMYTAGDDKSRTDGKQMMLWGIIALFLMVTLWGVVAIIKKSFFG